MINLLNPFSTLLFFVYVLTLYVMTEGFTHDVIEGFGLSIWLLLINGYAVMQLPGLNAKKQKKHQDVFRQQFFIMTLVFFLSSLVNTVIHHNNADFKGWWIFYINFFYLVSLLFSFLYYFISYLFSQNSALYTYLFALFFFVPLVLLTRIPPLANDRGLCSFLAFLLTVHFILCGRGMIKNRMNRLY
ncbi:hypothetical protein ELY21_11020 [Legionella sp. km535]|uniref:hypothetical protein n=1 Tax=Legionella sp. km535 TaxID=2498107 RepID=UPI000F8CF06D|nr:hypothetical protein [Legionella sp. km535]RUR17670.1 hypothetical protein ELY21_11020 [Legionella sp. km535]